MLLAFLVVLPAGFASAQDNIAQQLLRESFACPAKQYVGLDNRRTHTERLSRSQWLGDNTTLKVRLDTREMIDNGKVAESNETVITTALFKNLASVSVSEGARVVVSCKPNQMCITNTWLDADNPAGTVNPQPDWSFLTCDATAADNIRAAIQQLIDGNRGN